MFASKKKFVHIIYNQTEGFLNMVNLIRERNVSKPIEVKSLQELLAIKNEEPDIEKVQNKDKGFSAKKLALPLSLIGSGGILLYYGIKMPGRLKQFRNGVKNKKFEMNAELSKLGVATWDIVDRSFSKTRRYVQNYAAQYCLNPEDYLIYFRTTRNPKKILLCKDLALSAVRRTDNSSYGGGATDFNRFSSFVEQENNVINGIISRKRQRARQNLKDLANVPDFSDGKYPEHIQSARKELELLGDILSGQVDQIGNQRLEFLLKSNYRDMRDVIVASRHSRMKTKQAIIDKSFESIKKVLNLPEDFVPSYDKIPTGERIKTLTAEELKPMKLPDKLKEQYSENTYFNLLNTLDFSKLSSEDLKRIFYSSPYEMSLKDLALLIDEMRLEEVVAISQKSKSSDIFRIAIAKFEHLLHELNEFGEKELISRASEDFDNMSVAKRHASLYYLSTIFRRLGFATVEEMDKYFAKNNLEYKNLNIRNYMDIFRENPDIYFI